MFAKRRRYIGFAAATLMLLMILDTKTAAVGAHSGVELCISVLIPSLFPFFMLSSLLSNTLIGCRIPLLQPVNKLCGIPDGGESLLIIGLLGGYPIGARTVAQAYQNGQLTKDDSQRLLGFCNNAGPSFIFGMTAIYFDSPFIPWSLWSVT